MPETKRVQVVLPVELIERLEAAAEERIIGVNLLIERGCELVLDRLLPVEYFVRRPGRAEGRGPESPPSREQDHDERDDERPPHQADATLADEEVPS